MDADLSRGNCPNRMKSKSWLTTEMKIYDVGHGDHSHLLNEKFVLLFVRMSGVACDRNQPSLSLLTSSN